MAKAKSHPLNDQHLVVLNRLLKACAETDDYCKKCESCDLDVAPEARKNEEQRRIAEKIKRTFFPDAK